MDEEIDAIERNEIWELISLPPKKKIIRVKWIYKSKWYAEGKMDRHKAWLVVKGYKQQYDKDYDETYALVARMKIVCVVIEIIAQHKWKVYQMDVKSTFLNGVLKEEKWCNAMDEEIDAIKRNETWELTTLPPKKKIIGVKWVYKTKCNAKRKIYRHKAHLMVKGYKQ